MRRALMALLVAAATVGPVAAQSPAGLWEGTIATPGAPLRIVVRLEQQAEAAWAGTIDIPTQGAKGVRLSEVSVDRSTIRFVIAGLPGAPTFVGALSANGSEIAGRFTQGTAQLAFTLIRNESGVTVRRARPQEPMPPLPYTAQDVTFENAAAGVRLAGTLTLPPGAGPHPAVVLISGSGPQDRDESLFDHKPFLVLADSLTRRGIAVLRFDDRGVGGSTGNPAAATTEDFAGDVAAAVAFLSARPDVRRSHVGLIGHSEGGLIASLVAHRTGGVAFQVLLATPGLPGETILYEQSARVARTLGATAEQLAKGRALQEQVYAILKTETDVAVMQKRIAALNGPAAAQLLTTPWFRFFLTYDPAPTMRALKIPTLALNGENDLQVPGAENLKAIEAALKAGGNTDVTVRLLPRLNHLFQSSKTGLPAEYGQIDETFAPEALEIVSSWILDRTR